MELVLMFLRSGLLGVDARKEDHDGGQSQGAERIKIWIQGRVKNGEQRSKKDGEADSETSSPA